ncbi:hypothetical protein Tco_0774825 [Tanacetum coccineum]|uniref:Uncharacterized protein n=1 Tax=Tanacetum coccineum TaxID=301880 RepID=A0ABQ4ZPK3_9ASTR
MIRLMRQMDTPLDFSAFVMNRLKVDTLTPELLAGLTFELMKESCKSLVELEYFFEEVYKATTDQLDWNNPEESIAVDKASIVDGIIQAVFGFGITVRRDYDKAVDPYGFEDGGEVFRYSDTIRLSRSDEVLQLKNLKKDAILKLFKITYQERNEHVFKITFSHSSQDKGTSSSLKSMITTSNHKLMIEVEDHELKTKDKA